METLLSGDSAGLGKPKEGLGYEGHYKPRFEETHRVVPDWHKEAETMTIAAVARKAGPFINDKESAIVGPFPFAFKIFALTDVKVLRSKTTDLHGVSETLKYGEDYTVTADLTSQDTTPGGSVTLTGTIASGTGTLLQPGFALAILSNVPYSQLTKLTNYDRFMPDVLNTVHDRAVADIQQLVEQLDRTVTVPATSSQTPEELVETLQKAAESAEKVASAYAEQAGASAAQSAASAELAKAWATKTDGKVENEDYSAKQYALNAKATADGLPAKELELEGKLEDFTDTQIERIQDETDDTLVANATGCAEKTWTLDADVSANTEITIPGNIFYIVGRHHLRVVYNGLQCYLGSNFVEVGNTDTKSNKFKLTFDAKAGDELDVWVAALGKADVADAISTAQAANDAVAELSQKVVYKDAESAGS